MNNGLICIPICSASIEGLEKKIVAANEKADVIEIRFDCISPDEFGSTGSVPVTKITKLLAAAQKPIITTFRIKEQGGDRDISADERQAFWNTEFETEFCDLEEDVIDDSRYPIRKNRICSFHDFSGTPKDLDALYERLRNTGADILKIAVKPDDITHGIPVWKLLAKAGSDGKVIIPVAMGESGKWVRILGLGHGAFLTYASLDLGEETAPGQITVDDLTNVYRSKELTNATEVFGIIAGDTSYSMSPYIHNAAFATAKMDRVFVPLQTSDLSNFMRQMVRPETREIDLNFGGFSVTNPHKQAIIPLLDEIDETAKKIGAVNTVKILEGKLFGYNTDAAGFIAPLTAKYGGLSNANVAVVGAGGAARACIYALKQAGANTTVFARNVEKAAPLAADLDAMLRKLPTENCGAELRDFDILINTTPIGTRGPTENQTIFSADDLSGIKLVYDLIYVPEETRLLREAKLAGCQTLGGLEMLIGQAVRQFEIWTGEFPETEVLENAARKRLALL